MIYEKKYSKSSIPVICLMGPTAAGKSQLAILMSQNFSVEIISVDSALIYRGMDIGTAKPSVEELMLAPHRLIDIRDPIESYSVSDFCYDASKEIAKIICAKRVPLLVGGSMLYFKLLLDGIFFLPPKNSEIRESIKREAKELGWRVLYEKLQEIDLVSANKIHCSDHHRLLRALEVFYISGKTLTEWKMLASKKLLLDYRVYLFGIFPGDRLTLHNRIEKRFHYMLEIGFEDEVRSLFLRFNLHENMQSMSCIGYRQMLLYLSGRISYNDMVFRCISATRQLAKHQMTWLRKWSNIHWLNHRKDIFFWMQEISQTVNLN